MDTLETGAKWFFVALLILWLMAIIITLVRFLLARRTYRTFKASSTESSTKEGIEALLDSSEYKDMAKTKDQFHIALLFWILIFVD